MRTEQTVRDRRGSMIRNVGRLVKKFVATEPVSTFPERYTIHRGSILPPRDQRMGGTEYEDDDFFLDSAIGEARRVAAVLKAGPDDLLVDIGCGEGRLPIGLLHESCSLRYLGLDVKRTAIAWCQEYLQQWHPAFRFEHVDVLNARYNPTGRAPLPEDELPVATGSADIVYMWGVLTNMEPEYFPLYAREAARILRHGGRAFVTAHVEAGVPDASVNPDRYTPYRCDGPLHAVRYEREYFIDTFRATGLTLTGMDYHAAGNCQSELYFVRL